MAADARIRVDGAFYDVDADLAGETVTVGWGLFDHEPFVEFRQRRFGPYRPSGGPIPLHRYRKRRMSASQKRLGRIGDLASKLSVPRTALSGVDGSLARAAVVALRGQPFVDPDPYGQFTYGGRLDALRGVSDLLHRPLARLAEGDLAFINALVERTLDKAAIEHAVLERFMLKRSTADKENTSC